MRKTLLLFIIILLFNGCSKDDKNTSEQQNNETFNLSTNSNSVIPYQIVEVLSDNLIFEQASYSATFNDNEVVLTKNENGNLVFAIPNVSNGNYELKLNTQNKEGKLLFTVGINVVQDVDATINEEFLNPLSLINQNVDDFIAEGNLSVQTINKLNSAKQMYNNFISQFASASSEDKLILAKFFKANPIFTTNFDDALTQRGSLSNSDFSCYLKNSLRISLVSGAFVSWVNVIGPAIITALGGIGTVIVGVGTLVGVYYAMAEIEASIERLRTECLRPISNILYDQQGNSNNFSFNNNAFSSFNLKLGVRASIASDIDDENAIVSELMTKINYIRDKWEYFKNSINQVVTNSTSWFNNWFSNSASYEPVTSEIAPLPESSSEIEIDGKNTFVTLEGIPNNITAQVQTVGESGYNIKFNTDNANLPQNFQMTIKYDDGDFQLTDTFDVTLTGESQLNLNGVWRLKMFEENGTCTNNATPIYIDTVEDYNITPNSISIWNIDWPWEQTYSDLNYDEQTHEISFTVTSTYSIICCHQCSDGVSNSKLGATETITFTGQLGGDNIFYGITTKSVSIPSCSIDNHQCTYNSSFKAY